MVYVCVSLCLCVRVLMNEQVQCDYYDDCAEYDEQGSRLLVIGYWLLVPVWPTNTH